MLLSHPILVVVSAALLVVLPAFPAAAKPTREEVIAYGEQCKSAGQQMDLVSKFGKDFTGIDLSGVDLRGPHRIRLETIATDINFTKAELQNCQFGAANLDDAELTGADLTDAQFVTASLRNANFKDAILTGVSFYQCRLDGANLVGADLSRATITGSSFAGAALARSKLAGAQNEYWWNSFQHANLKGANLRGLKLAGARFEQANLQETIPAGADLTQADFTGADLSGADMSGAIVKYAVFHHAIGLDDDARRRLEQQSQRWKFDFEQSLSRFGKLMYWPTYLILVVVQVALTVIVYRRRGASILWLGCAPINGAMLVVKLPQMLAQFVVFALPLPGQTDSFWTVWIGLWALLVFLVSLAGPITWLSVMIAFVAQCDQRRSLWKEKLQLLHALLTLTNLLFLGDLWAAWAEAIAAC